MYRRKEDITRQKTKENALEISDRVDLHIRIASRPAKNSSLEDERMLIESNEQRWTAPEKTEKQTSSNQIESAGSDIRHKIFERNIAS